ncbi:unnamed protein product [Soboliphyme baturini]|uniref:KASH domain-containing protein n=1 Tax=Soboliphyme baturini TaxID=241478 RepID=A0A183IYZ2_9BILA|nr:unnamed protein product [Soboliphyme baturini]
MKPSPQGDCCHNDQTMQHIISEYSLRQFDGSIADAQNTTAATIHWLKNLDIEMMTDLTSPLEWQSVTYEDQDHLMHSGSFRQQHDELRPSGRSSKHHKTTTTTLKSETSRHVTLPGSRIDLHRVDFSDLDKLIYRVFHMLFHVEESFIGAPRNFVDVGLRDVTGNHYTSNYDAYKSSEFDTRRRHYSESSTIEEVSVLGQSSQRPQQRVSTGRLKLFLIIALLLPLMFLIPALYANRK